MTPGSTFVESLAAITVAPGIRTHSIVAVQGNGPAEKGDDGIVEYASAHQENADSEIVVRSGHSVQGHPLAIAEVRRILRLHAAEVPPTSGDGVGGDGANEGDPAGPEPPPARTEEDVSGAGLSPATATEPGASACSRARPTEAVAEPIGK